MEPGGTPPAPSIGGTIVTPMSTENLWKLCSSCRKVIEFGQAYWLCNVSTCNRKRTGMFFCSVPCWEAHLPNMRHREAWAVEKKAPTRAGWQNQQVDAEKERAAARRAKVEAESSGPTELTSDVPREILVIASKLKKYIKARSGFNTSDKVMMRLSDHLRRVADQAIRNAGEEERKTVLDRDVPPVPRDD